MLLLIDILLNDIDSYQKAEKFIEKTLVFLKLLLSANFVPIIGVRKHARWLYIFVAPYIFIFSASCVQDAPSCVQDIPKLRPPLYKVKNHKCVMNLAKKQDAL